MRISDWSSDVCSSDLIGIAVLGKDQCHLGQCLECIFDVELHRGRLVDRGGWNTKVGDRDVLLVELRHELLSKRTERSEEHTSELQSLMRISYAVFCLKKKKRSKKLIRKSNL